MFSRTDYPHGWRPFLGGFLPGSLCSSAVESAQEHRTLHKHFQLLAISLIFPYCFREWFSLGLLQMSWNSCFLWEIKDSAVLSAPSPVVPGFEASALGTAGGRGVWSEEGVEGLLLLL